MRPQASNSCGGLAVALGTTAADLLPVAEPPYSLPMLREQTRKVFESPMVEGDRETLLLLNPLMFRFLEPPTRRRLGRGASVKARS